MAYVYRHIRLDTNQPFYIGIGSDQKFKRVTYKYNRNKYWNNIVSKSEYECEILFEGVTWGQACLKEIEFIKLYGRKDRGGILANLTDGGEGIPGAIKSKETRDKIGAGNKGKKMSAEGLAKCKARKCPEWLKEKNRALCLGKKVSESTREKLREFNKGKVLSEEHVSKIAASNKAKNRTYVASEQAKINMKAAAARKRIRILIQKHYA